MSRERRAGDSPPGDDAPDADDERAATPTDGRYLYCLVDLAGPDDRASDRPDLSVVGIEDASVRVVTYRGSDGAIGAVVHDCTRVYDTDDPTTLQQWLLAHQRVVDDAGDAFGTPLPVRFDTIIRGGTSGLRTWLDANEASIRAALDRLAGHWEYRIDVHWHGHAFDPATHDDADRLAELDRRLEAAGEGKRFLLEKQIEERRRELRRERAESLFEHLHETVTPIVSAVESRDPADLDDLDPIGGLAVLCPGDRESRLGDALDEYVADRPVQVRFTGPWPPYSFAPEL